MNLHAMIEETSEDNLKAWLTAGFRDDDWAPVTFELLPTVAAQIQTAFGESRAVVQEKLRRAVIRAIAEWTPNAPKVLASLCVIAGYVKATRVAPILKNMILKHLVERDGEPAFRKTLGLAIGALAGLAPHPDASDAIETLYYSSDVPERYAAQLLNGMVRTDAGSFPRYLPRFVEIAVRHEGLFRIDIILDRLVADVTPARFAEQYTMLSPHTRSLLDYLLPRAGMFYDPSSKEIAYGDDSDAIRANIDAKMQSRAKDQQVLTSFLGMES